MELANVLSGPAEDDSSNTNPTASMKRTSESPREGACSAPTYGLSTSSALALVKAGKRDYKDAKICRAAYPLAPRRFKSHAHIRHADRPDVGVRVLNTGEYDGCSQEEDLAFAQGHAAKRHALKAPTYVEDKESGEPRRPHQEPGSNPGGGDIYFCSRGLRLR